jgi:tRNA pseudouridine38-40 synthase
VARWLVRFGYDGVPFQGWARQPGARTIEGEILAALARSHRAGSQTTASIDVASRTDRGVSARGNAVAIESDLSPRALLRQLNGIAPEIYFTAATEIAAGVRVRAANFRRYRYVESSVGRDAKAWERAARLFQGTIDVRSFGRGLPASPAQRRMIDYVRRIESDRDWLIEIRAPSFVWGMVRKIVAALRMVEAGELSVARLAAAVEGRTRLTLPMAAPEPLILWEVAYPFPWSHHWGGPNRHQRAYLARTREQLAGRLRWIDALSGSRSEPD